MAAPIVVGSSFLSPESGRLGKSRRGGEHRGGGNQRRPGHVPHPDGELLKVADGAKAKKETCVDREAEED